MPAKRPTPGAAGLLDGLTSALKARFPDAEFAYRLSPDGMRGYLDVVTACEDDFAVLEVSAPLTVDLLLEHGVEVHVFSFRAKH